MSDPQILLCIKRILGEKTGLEKMHQVTPKECHLHAVKRIFQYLKGHPKLGLWYPKASPFDLVASPIVTMVVLLKTTIVATSTTEAEYVAAASCCGQVLWIQNQLLDYGEILVLSLIRMVRPQFYNYHNMVAILEKGEFNSDFHPMVDFIAASPL
nr:hypothetical protein [Tanacetum cinerariifolium]